MGRAKQAEAVADSSPAGDWLRPASVLLTSLAVGMTLSAAAVPAHAGRAAIHDPSGNTVLQVAFRQPPTYQDLAEAQAALTRMAAIICDSTEGQVRIGRIRLVSSPASEDLATFWFHDGDAASGGPYSASGADLHRLGAHMDVFSSARLRPDRLAHLFGHHAFGLGDQYDDQRRRGGSCGIGPGFQPDALNETNHSIMQGAGGMRCSAGHLRGQECLRDDECAGAPCHSVLASEWSTPANHDLFRGDDVCPSPSAVSRVRLGGLLPSKAEPMGTFVGKDFLTARATSAWSKEMEVLGPVGVLPGIRLHFFVSHLSRLEWQLTVAADDGEFGGNKGEYQPLKSWKLRFNDDYSLAATEPAEMRFQLPSTSGRGPVEVAIDVGTRNPDAEQDPGHGYDGLQMVTAGKTDLNLVVDGVVGCAATLCASSWNESTGRWELSEQSILHAGASDWETITQNFPFLSPPKGAVAVDPPAICNTPPEFLTDVMGTDQVVFILDTSLSMGLRVDGRPGEVCRNDLDDDGDGVTDEADCADSRLEYQRVAVLAFLALAERASMQVGLVAMHTDADVVSEVAEMGSARRAVLGAVLGTLSPDGDTALGTALERAQDSLAKVHRLARSRTIVLITDGANNVGVAPGQEAKKLDPFLYRVFPVGIGSAADGLTLAAIAARDGGVAYATESATALPAVLAELAARQSGNALVVPRTMFEMARPGAAASSKVTASRQFEFHVEEGAHELVVFLASGMNRIDEWNLLYDLRAPDGERLDDTAPQNQTGRGFGFLRITDPKPGRWVLRVLPNGSGVQKSELLAYTSHDDADFFVDADPRLASVARSVHLSARPSYATDLDGDVSVAGDVKRPDGTIVPLVLTRDPVTLEWGTDFDSFAGRGYYEARLRVHVAEGARPTLGEPIFPGPPSALVRVVPFDRSATASFYVADGPQRSCSGTDCDGDGLADRLEKAEGCKEDADGDGVPNLFDADSDNDEVFDGEEGAGDLDKDGVPNFCDAETTPVSLSFAIEAEESALTTACEDEATASRDGLRASLSAVRRILQVVRIKPGIATETRAELVEQLETIVGLKKQALVIGDVLPEFCEKFKTRIEQALAIERGLRVRVDPHLAK